MYINAYYSPYPPYYRIGPSISYIRILHAVPDAPPVDIYIDGNLAIKNLYYKRFTEYIPLQSKLYNIKVYPSGTKKNAVINTNIFIPEEKIFTAAAIGTLNSIDLKLILDPRIPIKPNQVKVRFIHLSPNTPNVDITLPDGTKLFEDVEYKEVTDYIDVAAGVYTLQAKPAGTNKIALTVPNVRLKRNRFYSVYAVGLLNGKPPLQVLIPLDGNTYLQF